MLRAAGGSWFRFVLTAAVLNVPIAMLVVSGVVPMTLGAAGSGLAGVVLRVLWSDHAAAA